MSFIIYKAFKYWDLSYIYYKYILFTCAIQATISRTYQDYTSREAYQSKKGQVKGNRDPYSNIATFRALSQHVHFMFTNVCH